MFAPPIRPNIVALTWSRILGFGTPKTADQPEAYRDVLFDTQSYASTTTTQLTFFNTLQTDKTLGNMPQAGSLPAAVAFVISAISSEWLFDAPSTTAGLAQLKDAVLLMTTGRPIMTLTISDKGYGPWPLAYAGANGGPTADMAGSTTADTALDCIAQNMPNGGFFVGNALWLLPNVQFAFVTQWAAAQTLTTTPRLLRVAFHGTRYRRVT